MINTLTREIRTAYFSMEIALENDIPTYSGGLGVLAGDTLRSAADIEIPMIAVSLVSRAGYFSQKIDNNGIQIAGPDNWRPEEKAKLLDAKVAVNIEGRQVWIAAWLYNLQGYLKSSQPVILLDTDLQENNESDQLITHYLYGSDITYRLKQEIVLGIGGIRMLQALGFKVRRYHMNEGHSAMLALELLNRYQYPEEDIRSGESPYDTPYVRSLCCFTTHTPVEAGHDKFPYDLVQKTLGDHIDPVILRLLAGSDSLNMTRLALNLSEFVNGVAQRHAEISNHMFPGYHVHTITNGVHPFTWTTESFRKLYDKAFPGWCHEPQFLARADCCIQDHQIWQAHYENKQHLVEAIKTINGCRFNPELPTIGFARRMTAYKRPDLLFSDLERLKDIAKKHPFQLVFAGKAHPNDQGGKQLIQHLHEIIKQLDGTIPMTFIPNYNMDISRLMVAGVDVWLNTPMQPMEASGTSGMKAAFNGVPHFSVLDGWWIEGCIEGITGWSIGETYESNNYADASALYEKLEKTILPLYYQNRTGWIAVMKGAICKNASFFNSHRMMRRYATEAYIG